MYVYIHRSRLFELLPQSTLGKLRQASTQMYARVCQCLRTEPYGCSSQVRTLRCIFALLFMWWSATWSCERCDRSTSSTNAGSCKRDIYHPQPSVRIGVQKYVCASKLVERQKDVCVPPGNRPCRGLPPLWTSSSRLAPCIADHLLLVRTLHRKLRSNPILAATTRAMPSWLLAPALPTCRSRA